MFGMGFTEILIIAVIAILFLGPDKLPSTMVEIAKFFRSVKNTVGNVKDSIEQEMNVASIKEEALAYKKELEHATASLKSSTDIAAIGQDIASSVYDDETNKDTSKDEEKVTPKAEKVTFEKKKKKEKDENVDV